MPHLISQGALTIVRKKRKNGRSRDTLRKAKIDMSRVKGNNIIMVPKKANILDAIVFIRNDLFVRK